MSRIAETEIPETMSSVAKKLTAIKVGDGPISSNIWRSRQEPNCAAQLSPPQVKAFWDFCVQAYGKEGLTKILTGEEP